MNLACHYPLHLVTVDYVDNHSNSSDLLLYCNSPIIAQGLYSARWPLAWAYTRVGLYTGGAIHGRVEELAFGWGYTWVEL